MAKRGNPNINEANKNTRFTPETAREAQKKSSQKRRENAFTFKAVQGFTDTIIPNEELDDNMRQFFALKGITQITPMMKELAPIWLDAQKGHDLPTLMNIYRLLGLTFDSKREQNINVAVGNKDDKPFEINFIMEKGSDV